MTETSQKKAITAHFITHWGVPRHIHVQEQSPVELAVLEFGPRAQRQTLRFATNGMSAYIQFYQTKGYRTELYTSSRSNALWIIQLLAAIAKYPVLQETRLGEFDTIPVGGPIDQDSSPFTAVLIAPPGPDEAETLGAILDVTPEPILVHQVVAITDSELNFAIEHGGERLWERLIDLGRPLLLDEMRPEAVLGHV